jgi:RNA 3'-terminal phosphate cyclase (ATP)
MVDARSDTMAPPAPPHASSPPTTPLVIDGSVHEGGGQIVRNALALAACTADRRLAVTAIRAGRPKPGLRPQHCAGLRLVAALSAGSTLGGCAVGSTDLAFTPGVLVAGPHAADAGTAGSTLLMAQAALPAALLAGRGAGPPPAGPPTPGQPSCSLTTTLDLRGGTDAAMAPPADYAALVLLPTLRRVAGVDVGLAILRRGFFPRGGGHVRLTARALLPGQALAPLVLDRLPGDGVVAITITAVHAGKVRGECVRAAAASLEAALGAAWGEGGLPAVPATTITPLSPAAAPGDGGSLTAVVTTRAGLVFGASAPLTPKDDPAALGTRLGAELAEDCGGNGSSSGGDRPPVASVDRWLADQLVIFAALAGGASRWTTARPPTPHARAAWAVAAAVTGARFTVAEVGGGWTVRCEGAGVPAGQQRQQL